MTTNNKRFAVLLGLATAALGAFWFSNDPRPPIEVASTSEATAAIGKHEGSATDGEVPRSAGPIHVMDAPPRSPIPQATEDLNPLWIPRAPVGRPFAEVRADLQRRADTGDAAAASALFRGLMTCEFITSPLRDREAIMKPWLPPGLSIEDVDPEDRARILQEVEHQRPATDFAKAHADYCIGTEGPLDDHTRYAAALQAAKLGDETAAACFVGGAIMYLIGEHESFDVIGGPEVTNPTDPWIAAQYRENALNLAERGITRGDWRMVDEMLGFYGNNNWLLSGRLIEGDPVTYYAYWKLWQLGRPPSADDASQSEVPAERDGLPMSLERKIRAEKWAADTYARYFAGHPPLTNPYPICDLD